MRYAKIGGQALIEGIMMRHQDDYAVAVRKSNKEIVIKKEKHISLAAKWNMQKVPIIRGVLAFVDSMALGMSTLSYSASFFEEEEEEQKEPTKKSEAIEKLLMSLMIMVSIALAIGLFMVLPFFISSLFKKIIASNILLAVIEGVVRIALFLGYIVLISNMKDIQRVFMYHGAEHKAINCIESGKELTIENAKNCSRLHKRCGTSFMFIFIIVSIIVSFLIRIDHVALKVLFRILLVPVIAGVAYEIIQWAGRSDSALVDIVSKPGMWIQKLTTKEPDDEIIEVAIQSVEAIYDWRAFQQEGLKNE